MIKFDDFFNQDETKLESFFDALIADLFPIDSDKYEGWSYGHYFCIGAEEFGYRLEVYNNGDIELYGTNPGVNVLQLVKFMEDNEIIWG
jgi:hypothetical protein